MILIPPLAGAEDEVIRLGRPSSAFATRQSRQNRGTESIRTRGERAVRETEAR